MKIKPNTMHQVYGAMRWVLMYVYSHLQSVVSTYKEQQSVKAKRKPIPLQAWTDPVSSRNLRLPDFKTTGT